MVRDRHGSLMHRVAHGCARSNTTRGIEGRVELQGRRRRCSSGQTEGPGGLAATATRAKRARYAATGGLRVFRKGWSKWRMASGRAPGAAAQQEWKRAAGDGRTGAAGSRREGREVDGGRA